MIPEVRYTLQDQTLGALLKYKCIQSLKANIDIVVSVRKLSFELNFKIWNSKNYCHRVRASIKLKLTRVLNIHANTYSVVVFVCKVLNIYVPSKCKNLGIIKTD